MKHAFESNFAPESETWHPCRTPIFPRRTIDGGRTGMGQTWRRKVNGKWQYKQDAETTDEYYDRQY